MSLLKTYVYTSNINFLVCHGIKLIVLCTICNHIYVFWFVCFSGLFIAFSLQVEQTINIFRTEILSESLLSPNT